MDDRLRMVHFVAGYIYGKRSTCGTKVNYIAEDSANRSASAMFEKTGRKLEAYPCFFCCGWHIGRAMSETEYQMYFELVDSFVKEEDNDD